jgi:hypothetical protein
VNTGNLFGADIGLTFQGNVNQGIGHNMVELIGNDTLATCSTHDRAPGVFSGCTYKKHSSAKATKSMPGPLCTGLGLFCGSSFSIENDIVTDMVVSSLTEINTSCISTVNVVQSITLNNTGAAPSANSANGKGACIAALKVIRDARQKLEADAEARNPAYTAQSVSGDLATVLTTGSNLLGGGRTAVNADPGPCDILADIYGSNLGQSATADSSTTCNVTNSITNVIENKIKGKINSALVNQQDILGQITDSISSSRANINLRLNTMMAQSVTTRMSQALRNRIVVDQVITVTGNSIYLDRVSQKVTVKQTGSLLAVNTVVNELSQSADYAIEQLLVNKNDTIGDLLQNLLGFINTFSDFITNTLGQGLVLLFLLFVAVVFAVAVIRLMRMTGSGATPGTNTNGTMSTTTPTSATPTTTPTPATPSRPGLW